MVVLLKYYNDYDQHGGYFCGVFSSSLEAEKHVDHIGRENDEYYWYEIEPVKMDEYVSEI